MSAEGSAEESALLTRIKIALLAGVGIWTLAASATPWVLQRAFSKRGLDLIWISCALAAGVVFGAYLCHLTPDANEAFTAYLVKVAPGNDKLVGFPFAQVLSGAVFILLYAIDKLVVEKGMSGEEHAGHGKQCDHVSASIQSLADKTVPLAAEHAHAHALSEGPHHRHPHDVIDVPSARTVSNESDSSSVTADTSTLMHAKGRPSANSAQGRAAVMRAYTFFVALSVHSVFDGMSIGIESTMSGMIGVIIAVVGHKGFDGLALAVPLYLAPLPRKHTIILLVMCALMTPLGIGIGMAAAAAADGARAKLSEGIVIGASAGSFLFISVIELLPASLADGRLRISKLAAFVIGWAGMSALAVVA